MKVVIIIILALYGAAVTAESLVLTDVVDGIGLPGYAINEHRTADPRMEGGGTGISKETMEEYVDNAEERINNQSYMLRHSYILSKEVFERIFTDDMSATGMMIIP